MPKMIFQTRKALKNDDWDKSYKDTFVSSQVFVTKRKQKEQPLTPKEVIAKRKMEEIKKVERRKNHFFHGPINFPQ